MNLKQPIALAFFGVLAIVVFTMCGKSAPKQEQAQEMSAAPEAAPMDTLNTLTDAEKAEGWQLLFDGKTLNGWHSFNKPAPGTSWIVQDGAIYLNAIKDPKGGWQSADGGDLTSADTYADFDLSVEWKIDSCGNSGIIYRAVESPKYEQAWYTGPEMQVLDNACNEDAKIPKHHAGDLYDVVASSQETVKPAGQWNEARVVVQGNHVEQWLNGVKVVDTEMGTDAWKKLLKQSKWKAYPDYSTAKEGHVVLQDHGFRVWFRNIKIKKL